MVGEMVILEYNHSPVEEKKLRDTIKNWALPKSPFYEALRRLYKRVQEGKEMGTLKEGDQLIEPVFP